MGNVVLSPALPSELLADILRRCVHPTTLVVCASQADFITDFLSESSRDDEGAQLRDGLVQSSSSSTLLQLAVSRHIRVAFVPTVVHLRAFLAAFDPGTSRVGPPPEMESSSGSIDGSDSIERSVAPPAARPSLFVYGFVQLHRNTSEWSAQGLAASAAVLVETAGRFGFDACIVDGRHPSTGGLDERVPVLSTVPRRQLQRAGYPLRTQRLGAVLGRWFRFAPGHWDNDDVDRQQKLTPAPKDYVRDSEDDSSVGEGEGDAAEWTASTV